MYLFINIIYVSIYYNVRKQVNNKTNKDLFLERLLKRKKSPKQMTGKFQAKPISDTPLNLRGGRKHHKKESLEACQKHKS